ncbi:MAG TPA: FAD-dependent oxidoreductase, partial [Planctomycetota bacterium]|nr:FAD-dependent oxidoreductase [Planctomycetota bacterium]
MTDPSPVVVIGGGVAGCAAAVASAHAGAHTILIEASRALGGVAVQGEHRTLCGLAPIDAPRPALLEPAFTSDWITAIADGSPYHQGRVWLWPTNAATLQRGLRARVTTAQVDLRLGITVIGAERTDAGILLRIGGQKLLA